MKKSIVFLLGILLVGLITSGCRRRVVYVKETRTTHYPPQHQQHQQHHDYDQTYDNHNDYNDGQCYEDTTQEIHVYTAPPRVRAERRRPRRPGRRHVWISGRWHWNGHRYVWISGRWSRIRRGHRAWVGGHWNRRGRGWIWVRGYWR
ncbi:hypothetical protein [Candidatus Uabimicrobium sp. HlEnr_7]|uniref:hypothetical protein n=1 Tax=Candidatus Uabimicrobium helgolandensis TaxID=3095367 RepID=UPI003557B629